MREKPGHVGVGQDVGRVLVVLRVRHRQADFGQARRPVEQQPVGSALPVRRIASKIFSASEPHALGLRRVHVVAAHELRHGRLAHVAVLHAAEQVVEHAVAQRALGHRHVLDVQLGRTPPA